MSPKSLAFTLAAAVMAATVYAGLRPIGPVPPLGRLLDPETGIWANAGASVPSRSLITDIPGLKAPVDVRYDTRGVPHIFASNEEDVYRALGYVVARDRLFQLDIQTRAATGRLTELVGPQALELDERARALGMPRGAERKFAALNPDSVSRRVMDAYSAGINAYIDNLEPKDYPIEYKLLNARPERWHSINSLHLLNQMGLTLAASDPDHLLLRAAALVGDSAAESVFPVHSPIQEPIEPVAGWKGPHNRFSQIAAPGAPDTVAAQLSELFNRIDSDDPTAEIHSSFASNNWAVSPSRTRNGNAILAGDPHLQLTLPSIWYEVQLVVPGKLDVYGVTIPGTPGVVIGFNRDVSWTFTNTGADVMDFYRETVDDTLNPGRYRVDGEWRDLVTRLEQYRDQSGAVIHTDTVRYTHRGPMTHDHGQWISMRWTLLEPSNEIRAFHDAEQTHNVYEFEAAMARNYWVPAQNILATDRNGSIAIRSTGHFPMRPAGRTGQFIFDGSSSASDWTGYWPIDKYPQSVNPAQGFLASANQEPENPDSQFGYLGNDTDYEVWRALRINQLLRTSTDVTVDSMIRWQTDPSSVRADIFVPYFLAAARHADSAGHGDPSLDSAAVLLGQWDRKYTRTNTRSVLFEAAMQQLSRLTWDELNRSGKRVATPSTAVLAELMSQPTNLWWDDRRTTDVVETRDEILARSLVAALYAVEKEHGVPDGGGWRWDRVQFANIYHLLQIPAFSALDIPVQGGVGTLAPSSGDGIFGPSWRMVVEMGPEVHAWGTLPGGQSGDPFNPRYTDHLRFWERGELEPLMYPRTVADLALAATSATLKLESAGR